MKKQFFLISLFLLLTTVKGAYAETVLTVTDNGSGSTNTVSASPQNTTTVTQSNNADIKNDTSSTAATGDNQANSNNGNATIDTGSATANSTTTNNNVNSNTASVNNCCVPGGTTINVSGNGADSTNTVDANLSRDVTVTQNNGANANSLLCIAGISSFLLVVRSHLGRRTIKKVGLLFPPFNVELF